MKRKAILFLVSLLCTVVVAFVLPYLLGNHTEQLKDKKLQNFKEESLSLVEEKLSTRADYFLVLSYKVDDITLHEGEPVAATVTAYTFFGIPYAVVDTDQKSAGVRLR